MMDYVTLMGAEDVRSAGRSMSSAASEILRAASYIDESLHRHQRFLDDWLSRFEQTVEKLQEQSND